MLAMALPPAPPTPITAMRGFSSSTCGGPILMLIRYSPCSGEPLPPALPCDPPDGGPAARIPVTALHYCDAGITQKINLSRSLRSRTAFERRSQPLKERRETGRASCRERGCQYV